MHIKSRTLRHWLVATCGATALIVAGFFLLARGRQAPSASEGAPGLAAREGETATKEAPVARKAREVLKAHCHRCHGQDGKGKGGMGYVLDSKMLVSRGKIVPGRPGESPLYVRLTSADDPMPPSEVNARPSQADIEFVQRWIEAGAPDFNAPVAKREFVTDAEVLRRIHEDLQGIAKRNRLTPGLTRYFTLTHLYNAGRSETELQTYRQGLSKLINSLSWHPDIKKPEPIDPAKTIFRINLGDYEWDQRTWETIVARYPYGVTHATPTAKAAYAAAGSPLPYVRADWFVFAASRPPLYHDMLKIPTSIRDLEKRLEVDVERNIRQQRVTRAGFNGSGVSTNNRLIERHRSGYGAYWKSYDFASNKGRQNLFKYPLGPGGADGFQADGGEVIFSLPNGLQGYMLIDANGERLSKAPLAIVSTDDRRNREVTNGISCMDCHSGGMIPKDDEVRKAVEDSETFSGDIKEAVRTLHPPKARFDKLLADDAARFKKAMEMTGDSVQKTDTVVLLSRRFEEELDLKLAAAEAGMKPGEFVAGLKRSPGLSQALALLLAGGTVKRDTFVDAFPELVRELELGAFQEPARDGEIVEPNAATISAFATLGGEYGVFKRDVSGDETFVSRKEDAGAIGLPGFSFAHVDDDLLARLPKVDVGFGLYLGGIKVSDAGLRHLSSHRQLRYLSIRATQVSDDGLKHLVQLKHLRSLDIGGTKVSDRGLKVLSGFLQLRSLDIGGIDITDDGLKHLAQLTQLRSLNLTYTKVHDDGLEHLAKLKQLQSLNLERTKVADDGLKHLAQLTQLRSLNLTYTKMHDDGLEHLAALKELRRLDLSDTKVSGEGLRHLAGLLRLRSLRLSGPAVCDDGLQHLAGPPGLQSLYLYGPAVGDAGLKPLATLHQLRSLYVGGRQISDAGFGHLAKLRRLESLHLQFRSAKVSEDGLKHLAQLKDLQSLDLDVQAVDGSGLQHLAELGRLHGLALHSDQMSDAGMRHLPRLKHLRRLTLHLLHTKVSDAGLQHLAGLDQLQSLYLSATNVSDAGLEPLSRLRQLRDLTLWFHECRVGEAGLHRLAGLKQLRSLRLDFNGSKVGDAGVRHLAGLKQLRHLYLSNGIQVSDAGLAHLADLRRLETLHIDSPKVTDEGLGHLADLNKLQGLYLNYCPVSAGGVAKLKESLPKTRIRADSVR